VARAERDTTESLNRGELHSLAQGIWRDLGSLKEDWLRTEFIHVTKRMGLAEITAPKTLRRTFATILQDANVDPLIRNELMGHSPGSSSGFGPSLGMTAVYTHTRPETKRSQLEAALAHRPATMYARQRLLGHAEIEQRSP
jgi:integrase